MNDAPPSETSSEIDEIFHSLRRQIRERLEADSTFRSESIAAFVRFLRQAVANYDFPWTRFEVPSDVRLRIAYTDEKRGLGLIRTITDLLISNLLGEDDVAMIFRDETNPIFTEQARATRKALRVFESAGGHFIPLKTDWLADFQTLLQLRADASAGTPYLSPNGERVHISSAEVNAYMASGFQSGLLDAMAHVIHFTTLQNHRDEQMN